MSAAARQAATRIGIRLNVNGVPIQAQVDARTSLSDLLRDQLQLTGTHVSCEQGVCGACTLLLDGRPVRGCIIFACACDGAMVQTIEGFDDDPTMHKLREAFSREHALQCGFCTPGMLITARDIVQRHPGLDETRLRHELAGNLCRCTGYAGIVNAVSSVANADPACADRAASSQPSTSQAEFVAFEARQANDTGQAGARPARPARVGSGPKAANAARATTQITESLTIRGCDAVRLWTLLADVSAAASCLPGASVERFDGHDLAGTVRIAFGPISAKFSGVGTVERDEASRTTVIRGRGRDPLSKTEAQATIEYCVAAADDDPAAAQLTIGMDYIVQGPLAQFSRSELVRSLVAQIVSEFGRNLESLSACEKVRAQTSAGLGVFGLLWRWLKSRIMALVGTNRS